MKLRLLPVMALLLALASGCQANQNAKTNQASPPQRIDNDIKVKQTVPGNQQNVNAQQVAQRLVQLAVRVPGVNDATAVVLGRTAIVGIDVNAHFDRSRVGTLKYSVAEALRHDPYGAKTIVTADPDLFQRLREMAVDVRNGRPISGLAEELGDIIGRIIPQLPKDTAPKGEPNGQNNVPKR